MPYQEKLIMHRALAFAAQAHHGQMRKGTDVPYIMHPFETAQILTKAGCSDEVIIAGLLHDTLEDTDTGTNEISAAFGLKVLGLVLSASEDKNKSWEERKQHTIDYLKSQAGQDEMLLACADKLANLRSIRTEMSKDADGSIWQRFKRGKDKQKWYYKELIEALSPLKGYDMYDELIWFYDEVFGDMSE